MAVPKTAALPLGYTPRCFSYNTKKKLYRVLLVITPIVFSWIFTVFWLGRWDVFRLTPLGLPKKGVAPFKNYQVWDDTALVPATGRPPEGYPVFTVRTAAVNALGIPTVFFLGAILAMQFKSY